MMDTTAIIVKLSMLSPSVFEIHIVVLYSYTSDSGLDLRIRIAATI